jgi:hypothetical protein
MPDIDPTILIKPFNKNDEILGSSDVCIYLNDYLNEIKAKTVIIEKEYIDKDFIIDYSKFYSRSFIPIKKSTTRYHFFNKKITPAEFFAELESSNNANFTKKLNDSYLGFVVKKPIVSGNPLHKELVGRTLLNTYDKKIGFEERCYIKNQYQVSLCGIRLNICSLPYQQQDFAVGACATIACWVSLFPLSKLFGTPILSPSEVTEKSVFFPSDCRNFPSDGLTIHQMKTYFNSLGLETEIIKPTKVEETNNQFDVVADIVKAYTQLNIPVIAGLWFISKDDANKDEIKDIDTYGHHAVVISGYRHHKRNVKELYVHDDAFGPYCYIKSINNNFLKWECRWPEISNEQIFFVNQLLIPIYPKIRLNFSNIYAEYHHRRHDLNLEIAVGKKDKTTSIEFLLYDIHRYKNFLLNKEVSFLEEHQKDGQSEIVDKNKSNLLTKSLPRFIWVIRYNKDGEPDHDRIYDGTDVLTNLIGHVEY